jgi:uncharacterized protein DUF3617
MKLRALTLCTLVLVLAVPLFAAEAKSPMKPGKWQITIQMDMPNMPMKMPPMTVTQCITKEQAENPQPPKSKKDADCKISDYKMDGNTVTWSIDCPKQKMTGDGKITFSGDTYDGVTNLKSGDMVITQKYSGKYLGACDK